MLALTPRPHRRLLVAISMAAMVAATVFSTSTAAAAERVRSQYQLEFEGSIDCGTFEDHYIDRFDVRETAVLDGSGNVLKIIYDVVHTSDDMNSVTGYTLHEHGHFHEVDDFVAGTYTITGNQEIINVPGSGIVLQDTGRIVLDSNFEMIFFAGGRKHSQILMGEEIFCTFLG